MKSVIIVFLLIIGCFDAAYAQSKLKIAKWVTLTASTASIAYGFTQNRSADHEYEDIERLCVDNALACLRSGTTDAFADAALESRYQNVLKRDDRAKTALVLGEIGLVASVVLFILDLPGSSTPESIPYEPKPLRFSVDARGLKVGVFLPVR